jgi:hypothetical protein
MKQAKPPIPVCKAFLICRQIVEDPNTKEASLVGQPKEVRLANFPASRPFWFFARWTSAHGDYQVEMQVQTPDGEVVCREVIPKVLSMAEPLKMYDLRLQMFVIFPHAGMYDFILLANGEEVARQPFEAVQTKN